MVKYIEKVYKLDREQLYLEKQFNIKENLILVKIQIKKNKKVMIKIASPKINKKQKKNNRI